MVSLSDLFSGEAGAPQKTDVFPVMHPAEQLSSDLGHELNQGTTPEQVDLTLRPRNPEFTNMMVLKAALAENHIKDTPQTYEAIADGVDRWSRQAPNDPGFRNMRDQITAMKTAKDYSGLQALLDSYVNRLDFPRAQSLTKLMTGLEMDQQQFANSKIKFHEAFVDSVTPPPAAKPEQKTLLQMLQEDAISKSALSEMVGDSIRGSTLSEKIVDWGSLFLVADMGKDLGDATKASPLEGPAIAKNFIRQWAESDHDTKMRTMPVMYKYFLDAFDGNKVKTGLFMQRLTEAGGAESAVSDAWLDNIFISFDIAAVLSGMSKLFRAGRNVVKITKDGGNPELAGKLNSSAVADGTQVASENVGTDRLAAAINAMPVDGTKVLHPDAYTPHIHGETMHSFQAAEAKLSAMLDDATPLRVEPLLESEVLATKERFLNKWRVHEDDPAMGFHEVTISDTTPHGFKVSAAFGKADGGAAFKTKKAAQARLTRMQSDGLLEDAVVEPVADGFRIVSREQVTYKFDDVGEYLGEAAAGPIKTKITSPSVWMARMEGNVSRPSEQVSQATRAELGKDVVNDALTKMINAAVEPLGNVSLPFSKGRASLKRVDEVLLQGDAHGELLPGGELLRGKTYTPGELLHGIDTPSGRISLTPDEMSAYYGLRRVADWMYVLKNDEYRNTLRFRGIKKIDVEGTTALGKPYETPQAARSATRGKDVQALYDPSAQNGAGAVVPHAAIDYDKMYASGYRLVGLDEAVKIDGKSFSYAWVKPDNIKELPQAVLNYKAGYVPKVNKDAYYFIKETKTGTVNGAAGRVTGTKTLRMFSSGKEAKDYLQTELAARKLANAAIKETDEVVVRAHLDKMEELGKTPQEIRELMEDAARGELSTDNISVVKDRELSSDQLHRESHGVTAGLFTSGRATHDIKFGVSGEVPKRYSAFESFQRYTQHISNYLPRNEWRIAAQQRWLNTAKKLGVVRPDITDYREAVASIQARAGSNEASSLKAAANWINDQARIPTKEEEAFAQIVRGMAEKLDAGEAKSLFGQGRNAMARTLLHFSNKDPYAMGRSAAFNLLLGWFNPAQLFVQAQGASIALALHPKTAMTALRDGMIMLSAGAHVDPAAALRHSAEFSKLATKMGMNKEDFLGLMKLWHQSGLYESVLSTADHAAAAQGFGVTANMLRKAADKGQVFYRWGELWNRLYSFSTSARNYSAKTGKSMEAMGREDLKIIIDQTFHNSLNLTRANRASWQKGILSMPTQFLQIQAKWLENALPFVNGGHAWTAQEKMQMWVIQTALYGSAGAPLGAALYSYTSDLMGGAAKAEQQDKAINRYINGGLFDMAFYVTLGAENDFGARGAIAEGLVETAVRAVRDQHDLAAVLGAPGQSLGKVVSGVGNALAMLGPLAGGNPTASFGSKEWAYVANEIAKAASSWNNLSKAYALHKTGILTDSRGNALVDKALDGGFSVGTIIGQALGFRPSDARAVQSLKDHNKAINSIKADVVDSILQLHHNYLGGLVGEVHNAKPAAQVAAIMSYYEQMIGDPVVWADIQKSVAARISQPTDERTKQIQMWYKNYMSQHSTGNVWSSLATGQSPATNPLLLAPGSK